MGRFEDLEMALNSGIKDTEYVKPPINNVSNSTGIQKTNLPNLLIPNLYANTQKTSYFKSNTADPAKQRISKLQDKLFIHSAPTIPQYKPASSYLTGEPQTPPTANIYSPAKLSPPQKLNESPDYLSKAKALGQSARGGLTEFNAGIAGVVKAADEWTAKNIFGGQTNKLLKPVYDYYLNENNRQQAAVQQEIQKGNLNPIVNELTQGTVGVIPTAALGLMTGGTSLGAQAGISAAAAPTTMQTAAAVSKELAKNPQFWVSMTRSFGSSYNEATANGVDTNTAIRAALLQAVPESIIEVSGGTEKLMEQLASKTKGLGGEVLKSALEEGLEEILQYPFQGIAQKATYAPQTPLFSTKEQAIINPLQQARAGLMGAGVGLIAGGGAKAINSGLNVLPQIKQPSLPQMPPQQEGHLPSAPLKEQPTLPQAPLQQESSSPSVPSKMQPLLPRANEVIPQKGDNAETNAVILKLRKNIPQMQFAQAVSKLTGNEFAKNEQGIVKQVGDFFKSIGNKVTRPDFGDVIIDEVGVQSDIAHGLGRAKSLTFAAVPDVIKNGIQIDYQQNWKNRGYDGYAFAAPIEIGNKRSYVTVIAKKALNSNSFYLHEVLDGSGRPIYMQSKEPSHIKTGSGIVSDATGGLSSSISNISPQNNNVNSAPPQSLFTFGGNTVGAAESNPNSYSALQNKFGTIKPGENPARTVEVPKSTEKGNKVRQFTRTVMEAAQTPETMIEAFETKVAEGLFSYKPLKDKTSLEAAAKTIEYKGYQGAILQWQDVTEGRRRAGKDDIVLGETLYALAAQNGDTDTAMRLASELSVELTLAGRAVQAARLLKKSSPEGKLYYANKTVENIQDKLTKKYKEKAPKLKIDKTLVEQYLETTKTGDESAQDAALDKIYSNVAEQVPVTLADKWNAWRYLSMLGNPKTHIRNTVGNAMFYLATKGKNIVGAGLEAAVNKSNSLLGKEQMERTKTFKRADKQQKDFAKQDYKAMEGILTGSGKYNPSDIIMDKRKIFTSKLFTPVEFLRKLNNLGLDAEDALFLRLNYIDSISKYLAANNISPESMSEVQLGTARSYAINEAQRATFRDASKLATALNRISNTNSFTKVILGGTIPFTKTPVNIAKRAIEYSPVGAVKAVKEMLVDVKSGNKTAAETIDGLASGLTGTGIMSMGFILAKMGLITGGRDDDEKQEGFDRLQGAQNYALQTGEGSYTLDWAAPTAIPLFMGVEFAELAKNGELTFESALNSITRLGEPLVEMSVLQGIMSAIKTAGYSEYPVSDVVMNSVGNYFGQAVPTLAGQFARAADDTRRSTYVEKGKLKPLEVTLQKAQAKIPLASKSMMSMVDAWGREVKNVGGSGLGRLAYNMLSPGYYQPKITSGTEAELDRIYKSGVEDNPFPTKAAKYFNVDGARIDLTNKQYEQFAKEKGKVSYSIVSSLMRNKAFMSLDDKEKADILNEAYQYANATARAAVSDYQLSKLQEKIKLSDIPVEQFLIAHHAQKELNKSVDKRAAIDSAVQGMPFSDREKLYKSLDAGLSESAEKTYTYPSVKKIISKEDYYKILPILSEVEANKDEFGNAIAGTAKPKEIKEIASALFVSEERAADIYNEIVLFDHALTDMTSKQQKTYRDSVKGKSYAGEKITEQQYIDYANDLKLVQGEKDSDGKTISGSLKRNRYNTLRQNGMSDSWAQWILFNLYSYKPPYS